jgi:hypothetical protein
VIRVASDAGMHSSTIANAPASPSATASARIAAASLGVTSLDAEAAELGDGLRGQPEVPITGMPASTSARTVGTTRAPPSSFTASAPDSFRTRTALARAWSGPS